MQRFAPLAVVAVALLMHFVVVPVVGGFYGKILLDIGINVLLAVSLNIVNGFTGQFSIGHAGFMAVGGYTAAVITFYGGLPAIWFPFACIAGGLTAALFGVVVGLPSLRLRGDYLAIVTLGFGEIVRVTLQRTDAVGGALGFVGLPYYTSPLWVYLFCGSAVLVAWRLKYSTFGRAFFAVRENEIAAEAMGVSTTRYKVRAFVLAAFFAGIGGALFAHEVGITLNPKELGFQKSFDVVIMVVLGGMGSITGSIIAAVVLTLLPEALRSLDQYRLIVYALALVIVMIVRPRGLLGARC
jgi:branched-chain amino acid transport system permease protein